jgi:hypothetical protein
MSNLEVNSIFDEGKFYFVVVDVDTGVDEVQEEELYAAGQEPNNELKLKIKFFNFQL